MIPFQNIYLQNKIWTTFEQDPLFSQSMVTESLEEQRRKTFLRVKRLFEYAMVNDDAVFVNPLKHKIFIDCLGMYDWALMAKYHLTVEFTAVTIESTGSSRHAEIAKKLKSFEVRYWFLFYSFDCIFQSRILIQKWVICMYKNDRILGSLK